MSSADQCCASSPDSPSPTSSDVRRIALLGNPNTGKTTLFNRISGLRAKTSNFPGTTLEARVTHVKAGVEGGRDGDLIDLPGIYSLELEQLESRVCRDVLAGVAAPRGEPLGEPECVVVVVDAANLGRNLMLVGEVLRRRLPTVVALNMMDVAEARNIHIDPTRLSQAIGCETVVTNARTGEGVDALRIAIRNARIPTPEHPVPGTPDGLRAWADEVADHAVHPDSAPVGDILDETRSDRVDRVLLNPVLGLFVFVAVMTGLFYTLFVLAHYPMGWIESIFGWSSEFLKTHMAEGVLRDLLSDGIIAGVGSTVIFLPQICLLFFLISLLEDTGYLARGAFLMDRLLRPFGLPGHAFVPLLSSHACALPGIMAARAIPDQKERLATILVAPFMTCSARLPVYVLITTLLFKDRPALAALAFVACYALGIIAGVFSALIARRTILRGRSRPMAMELPTYKWPSLRNALLSTKDRGWMFLRNAGVNILMICIVLWWLGAYPHVEPPAQAVRLRTLAATQQPVDRVELQLGFDQKPTTFRLGAETDAVLAALKADLAARLAAKVDTRHAQQVVDEAEQAVRLASSPELRAAELNAQADTLEAKHAKTNSYLGLLGRAVQPVFEPLGYDWQLTVGVLASFAAREVFVSTMTVVIAGQEDAEAGSNPELVERIQEAKRTDGTTPIFTPAASWSLLVFFVLAMQCLPTLVITARESGHWKWAALQLAWMSGLAYLAAMIVYQVMK
jgi:ferrous iron transport protein B